MITAALLLLAQVTPARVVGVTLAEADDEASARDVASQVARTLGRVGGVEVRAGGACGDPACEARSLQTLGADALLRLRVLRGLTQLQVTLERVGSPLRRTLDLPESPVRWDELLAPALAALFPPPPVDLAPRPVEPPPPPARDHTWTALLALAGVASAGTAAALAFEAGSTRRALLDDTADPARFHLLRDRLGAQSTAAAALLTAGALLGCGAAAAALLE